LVNSVPELAALGDKFEDISENFDSMVGDVHYKLAGPEKKTLRQGEKKESYNVILIILLIVGMVMVWCLRQNGKEKLTTSWSGMSNIKMRLNVE
jgi:hypothetical protein